MCSVLHRDKLLLPVGMGLLPVMQADNICKGLSVLVLVVCFEFSVVAVVQTKQRELLSGLCPSKPLDVILLCPYPLLLGTVLIILYKFQ